MAEIEKKYSDFQESECKDEQKIEIVDKRLCATCQPNPDFKIEGNWWEIKEAYLNEKFCEYHVRVYEAEAKRELGSTPVDLKVGSLDEYIRYTAAIKILNDLDKPLNDKTKALDI